MTTGCTFLNSLAELPLPTGGMHEQIREHKEGVRTAITELTRAHLANKSKDSSYTKGLTFLQPSQTKVSHDT